MPEVPVSFPLTEFLFRFIKNHTDLQLEQHLPNNFKIYSVKYPTIFRQMYLYRIHAKSHELSLGKA